MQAGVWRFILGAVLCALPAYAATPDQLYQTWQKNSLEEPEIAEKAAQDYLQAAPAGLYAPGLKIWLDAYHKSLDSLLAKAPQAARPGAPNTRQASAQPSPPPPPVPQEVRPPATPQASAQPSVPKPAAAPPAPPVVPPPQTRAASAIPPENNPQAKPPAKAPPSNSSGAKPMGPSLEEALAFIADRLDGEGRINFTAQFRDMATGRGLVERLSYKASNVTIDSNRCRLSFRWQVQQDRNVSDQDRSVELGFAKSITTETIDQALTDLNTGAVRRFSVRAQPDVYAVHIARWDRPSGDHLYFHSQDMAARVGEAAKHVLELCGGRIRQPDPRR